MKKISRLHHFILRLLLFCTLPMCFVSRLVFAKNESSPTSKMDQKLYQIEVKDIDGKSQSLKQYHGKVLLIVNTASACGFTPQLKALADLQKKYGPAGLQVLAFPSNDFKQDQGDEAEIKKFANEKYQINFPLFEKGAVSGSGKQAVYQNLVSQRTDLLNEVQWNFEKFLVDRKGLVRERFRSMTKPDDPKVTEWIEKLLQEAAETK